MPEKAYKNLEFLTSHHARSVRILSEYLEPQARFEHYCIRDTVVFFGSSRALSMDRAREERDEAERTGDGARIEAARAAVALAHYYEDARTLARELTRWSKKMFPSTNRRFIVCSGGGPGIMEAANRGASEASGVSVGLGISLPSEPANNPYITRELAFEFHYFFMRKFWFAYLAKGMVVFPGGFGTLDELFELLTLVQTRKAGKKLPVVLYGKDYWNEVVNFDALVRWGTVDRRDLDLFRVLDSPEEAFEYLRDRITAIHGNDGGVHEADGAASPAEPRP